MKRVIGVVSGKGGVGRSTVAIQLAFATCRLGLRVGLLDADLHGSSLGQMVALEGELKRAGSTYQPVKAHDLEMISLAHFPMTHGENRPCTVGQTMHDLVHNIVWSRLDTLFVDFPSGGGDIPATLCQKIAFDGVVVVSTPQKVALANVEKAVQQIRKLHVPIMGIVENMSYFGETSLFQRGISKLFAKAQKIPFLGEVPLDMELSLLQDRGKAHLVKCTVFQKIADRLQQSIPCGVSDLKEVAYRGALLTLTWRDGAQSELSAFEIQMRCPCARCAQEKEVDPGVRIKECNRVGNYGIRFVFSSGCSSGIYDVKELRCLG